MKTQGIISALLFSASLLTAQTTTEKPATVRIKKIEKINGVEKITDTTYTTTGPLSVTSIEGMDGSDAPDKNGKRSKIVIITDEANDGNVTVINKGEEMDEQMEKLLKEAGIDSKKLGDGQVMTINTDCKDKGEKGKCTKIMIVKSVKITEPSDADAKLLGKKTGATDGKLAMEQMNFYPNPNTGKFNLSFQLPEKGNTEISILNLEGKTIYHEKLNDFKGSYDKEIDISANPKGTYFVRISQGEHAQLKKIVLE